MQERFEFHIFPKSLNYSGVIFQARQRNGSPDFDVDKRASNRETRNSAGAETLELLEQPANVSYLNEDKRFNSDTVKK